MRSLHDNGVGLFVIFSLVTFVMNIKKFINLKQVKVSTFIDTNFHYKLSKIKVILVGKKIRIVLRINLNLFWELN